jgi:LPXTG-site transpeptidase (sortase) family protein
MRTPASNGGPDRAARTGRGDRCRSMLAGLLGALVVLTGCGASPAAAAPTPEAASTPTPATSTSAQPPSSEPPSSEPPSSEPPAPAGAAASTAVQPPTMPASAPVSLSVPAIGIDSPLIELGRNPDGTIEVPPLDDPDATTGWYRGSPTPGEVGPAIILGHVDSRRYGPGVFHDLRELRTGDAIDVARADGSVAHFAVDSVREVPKSDFPTLEVYGNLDHAGLRLITCGGQFDRDAASYQSNIIVFALLVDGRP